MKKLLLLLIALIFLAVSCSGSKKTENDDNAILPDEDVSDYDVGSSEEEPDEDNETEEENPCENFANVDGTFTNKNDASFECGCLEGYFWANPGCRKISYANICTGQATCHDRDVSMTCPEEGADFYGQDAHYAQKGFCTPKSFSSTTPSYTEGLTLDNNLRIAWLRKTAGSTYSWDEAVKYCEELEYEGFDDWRLPSPKELMFTRSLLNPGEYLWSSQSINTSYAYKIQVSSKYLSISQKSETNDVRCVRGEQPGTPLLYEIQGRNLVFDPVNGFLWNTSYTGIKPWQDALAYCENSTHSGFSDWRVPNIHELLSLVNYEKENPALDFPHSEYNFGYDMWWSSTTLDWNSNYARTAVIPSGETSGTKKYDSARVICVRNEPCTQGYFLTGNKCIESPCNGNPCKNIEHSDGKCLVENLENYYCGCNENYFWDGVKCVNPCDAEPCKNAGNSDQKCKPLDAFRYRCSCTENYHWWNKESGCIEKQPSSGNICTGQTKCYSNEETIECISEGEDFFGQDAHYAELGVCIPQSFSIDKTVQNEPTVVDNNTGLEWQQTFSEAAICCLSAYPCDEAVNYCEDLNYGGHDDWRLPTILELHTIVNSEKVNPSINTFYFPNTPSEYFISASSSLTLYASGGPHDPYAQDGSRSYWFIDFSKGISTVSPTNNCHIRCVRGERLPKKTFDVLVGSNKKDPEIAFNSNETLIWQAGTKSYEWQNALKYCENLNLAGLSNWRLPNKNELLEYFTPCDSYSSSYYQGYWYDYYPSRYHWSSTTVYDKPEKAWIVDYGDCLGFAHYDSYRDKTDSSYIYTRCVTENPCGKGTIWNGEICIKENPCNPNPCASQIYGTRNCIVSPKETIGYYCECSPKSVWNPDEKECLRTCEDNPCRYREHTDMQCYEDETGRFYCGCAEGYSWDRDKVECVKNKEE